MSHTKDSLRFQVSGATERDLNDAAHAVLLKFVESGSRWNYFLRIEPLVETIGGGISAWVAEVQAWREKEAP